MVQYVPEESRKYALVRLDEDEKLFQKIQEMGIPVIRIDGGFHGRYGGPKTLAKYRAFIEFPYQVSTMKLYENIAEGVVTFVPTHRFFLEIVKNEWIYFGAWENRIGPLDKLRLAGGDEWYKWMDYYSAEMSPFLYYFDSLQELKEILSSPEDLDTKKVREWGPTEFAKIAQKTVCGWADLFQDMKYSPNHEFLKMCETVRTDIYEEELHIPFEMPKNLAQWDLRFDELEKWKASRME
ncbi:hypothetical protein HDU82_002663 [Entophlyctis luteolus]|nr:hypothetical protein HDU82_002663 [Entophlyctis luteolus]